MSRAFLVTAFLALASAPLAAQATRWDSLARSLFKELVEINTTESSGSTLQAARAMAARLRSAGFPDSDVVVLENAPRKGNLVARLRGRSTGKKPILLLSHIDVVEAKAEDWTLPPFQFIERDGTFFGRGVADDKDESAIHLALIMRLREERFVPDRDIIVALTADEEGGGANGVSWLLQNHRALIDAEYAFNEGGGGRVRGTEIRDTVRVSNDVQASEKKFLNFRFEVTNPGGHSSVPRPDNAITQLAHALTKITPTIMPVRLNEVTRAYFTRLADVVQQEAPRQAAAMRAIVANPGDAAAAEVLSADPRYNSQLRTSCVATMLEGGHATNALPQRARANVNCRILPDETAEQVRAVLERVVGDTGVQITAQGAPTNSPPSPLTPALMSEIERVTREMWPGVPVIPTMSTGATDGLRLRNAGIPVYGVSGLFYPETFAHGMNERIPVRAFYQGLEFMYRLVKGITSGRPVS
ncbi:MAG: M20/M25/M40 family metallo-hydrolase [Gemmatimonadaceae bacterium]|nr:M20/M25/M40 family metallo-hydrolase [Gemmatimonadaceae bacterium]